MTTVGKIEYTYNKEFEEYIGSIISGLGHLNAYLVVTMREEIYQKFNPIGKANLKQYIKKLNIANHSYDSKRREEILCRWATVMNCKWFQDDNLRKVVLKYIEKDQTRLPTPLNIKDFASESAVTSYNAFDEKKLLEIVDRISQRTPERFARDIKVMKEHAEIDKILLLCFLFISGSVDTGFRSRGTKWSGIPFDFVKNEYNRLLNVFGIKDGYAFERAWKKLEDKIQLSTIIMQFSHPSYSEASGCRC